jgi:hypothetical protein
MGPHSDRLKGLSDNNLRASTSSGSNLAQESLSACQQPQGHPFKSGWVHLLFVCGSLEVMGLPPHVAVSYYLNYWCCICSVVCECVTQAQVPKLNDMCTRWKKRPRYSRRYSMSLLELIGIKDILSHGSSVAASGSPIFPASAFSFFLLGL